MPAVAVNREVNAELPLRGAAVRGGLAVAALGVVFGDIGTSPLYAMQTVFSHDNTKVVPVDAGAVYGVASLIVWAIVLVVLVKYVLIMRADHAGEVGSWPCSRYRPDAGDRVALGGDAGHRRCRPVLRDSLSRGDLVSPPWGLEVLIVAAVVLPGRFRSSSPVRHPG